MKNLLITGLSLLITGTAIAMPSAPTTCPKISDLVAQGYSKVESQSHIRKDWWAASNISNYGTQQQWIFLVQHISAISAEDALAKAKQTLTSISNPQGPTFEPRLKEWFCNYSSATGYPISTITMG